MLAAPVNGDPVGAGGVATVPVDAMVALALDVLAEPVPVTRGMRTGVDVEVGVVAGISVDEARTTVLKIVEVDVEVTVVWLV